MSKTWAYGLVFLLTVSAWGSLAAFATRESPQTGEPGSIDSPAAGDPPASGPEPSYPPSLDLGLALGLPVGTLEVGPGETPLFTGLSSYLSRHARDVAEPSAPPSGLALAGLLADPLLGIEAPLVESVLWRDQLDSASGTVSPLTYLLNLHLESLRFEDRLERVLKDARIDRHDLLSALESEARGTMLGAGAQSDLDQLQAAIDADAAKQLAFDLTMAVVNMGTDLQQWVDVDQFFQAAYVPRQPLGGSGPLGRAAELTDLAASGQLDTMSSILSLFGAQAGIDLPAPQYPRSTSLVAALEAYSLAVSFPLTDDDIRDIREYEAELDPEALAFVATIVLAAADSERTAAKALARVTPQELDFLTQAGEALMGPDAIALQDLPAGDLERITEISRRIDFAAWWQASHGVTYAVEAAAASYEAAAQAAPTAPFFQFPKGVPMTAPIYLLQVGTPKRDAYTKDAAINIDLGGDDTYTAAVGGIRPYSGGMTTVNGVTVPNVVCSATCVPSGEPLVQFAVDLFGDDVYSMKLAGTYEGALGGGFMAVGLFFEFGGNDVYDIQGTYGHVMGGAMEGFGSFIDYSGDDSYNAGVMYYTGMGAGYDGVGIKVDLRGDDTYKGSVYANLGASLLGEGISLDVAGNDVYKPGGYFCLGAGNEGVGQFFDLSGDDTYGGTCYYSMGAGSLGAGLFFDTGGTDSYTGGTSLSVGSRKDNAPIWVTCPTCYLGTGIGVDVGVAAVPRVGLDLVPQIKAPAHGFSVAPGAPVTFTVQATNKGTQAAPDVRGTLVLQSREDDPSNSDTHDVLPVAFDAVGAGQTVTRTVTWTSPPEEAAGVPRALYAALAITTPNDDQTNDVDLIEFTVKAVPDVRLHRVLVSASGKLPPSATVPMLATLKNYGNMNGDALVHFEVKDSSGNVLLSDSSVAVFSQRPTPIYEPTNQPTDASGTLSWRFPSVDGNYTVKTWITPPASLNVACRDAPGSALCKQRTELSQVVEVITVIDGMVGAAKSLVMLDPSDFEGYPFRVSNVGTVPFSGKLTLTTLDAYGGEYKETIPVDLAIDASVIVTTTPPGTPAVEGQKWHFTGRLDVDDDKTLSNNVAEFDLTFILNIITGDDFELDNPNVAAVNCGTPSVWRRGTPKIVSGDLNGLQAHSGKTVWGMGLTGGQPPAGTCHDLIYSNLDFTNYLDPYVTFFSAMDSYSYNAYAYSGGHVSARKSGAPAFEVIPKLDPKYPCQMYYNSEAGQPAICGQTNWGTKPYKADLTKYQGSNIDLRFRYVTYPYNYGEVGWFLDDLMIFGVKRLAGDLQVVSLDVNPTPTLLGDPTTFKITVRNNGYEPLDVPIQISLKVGTKDVVFADLVQLDSIGGAQKAVYSYSYTPTEAKRYLLSVDLPSEGDPRQGNNHKELFLDVYAAVAGSDLESLPSPCNPACDGWEADGSPAEAADDWEIATPADFPGAAASGVKAWTTEANERYQHGVCCITTQRTLTTPAWSIPEEAHENPTPDAFVAGDKFYLGFRHAYDVYGPQQFGYTDLAIVTASHNDEDFALLAPTGGYPHTTTFYAGWPCCAPPGGGAGWSGKTAGYEPVAIPLPRAAPTDTYQFAFTLWGHPYNYNYCGSCPEAGWSVDDINLLRGPRFDQDLAVLGASPAVLNIGKDKTLNVQVYNEGRRFAEGASVSIELSIPGEDPFILTAPVPAAEAGQVSLVPFDISGLPAFAGVTRLTMRLDWDADEWSLNDFAIRPVRFARVLYLNDFETQSTDFQSKGEVPFYWGAPEERPALQGAKSWSTGSLTHGSYAVLDGKKIYPKDPTGLVLPQVSFEGLVLLDSSTAGPLKCPYSGVRLMDDVRGEPVAMAPDILRYVYAFGEKAQCGDYHPLAFSVDLTAQQTTGAAFDPRFEVRTMPYYWYCATCYVTEPNLGAEIDALTLYGNPYMRNMMLQTFTAPDTTLLGPGERAKIEVQVTNAGLQRPDQPLGVRFLSNDRAQSGLPSLDKVIPVPKLEFSESAFLSTTWIVPPSLVDKSVRVTAQLVVNTGCKCVPVQDQANADNQLLRFITIVAVHDLMVEAKAVPSLNPEEVLTTTLQATLHNTGTLTEVGAVLSVRVFDEAGRVVFERPGAEPQTLAPDFAQSPTIVQSAWVPPSPGHYRLEASVSYPNAADDVRPDDNTAIAWIHSGVGPYRFGDEFPTTETDWTASGGSNLPEGFGTLILPDAPEGDFVLATNPRETTYAANGVYRYEFPIDLAEAGADAQVDFAHARELSSGDFARVLYSEDAGASWTLLQPVGGYGSASGYRGTSSGWDTATFPLNGVARDWVRFRFELVADAFEQGTGWRIDDLRIRSGSTTWHSEGFESPLGEVAQNWDFEDGGVGWTHSGNPSGLDDWATGTLAKDALTRGHSGQNVSATGLRDPYTWNSVGTKTLRSPAFVVPSDATRATVSWWQLYGIMTGGYSTLIMPQYSDSALLGISVNNGPFQLLQPTEGYPYPISAASGSPMGFTGSNHGWEQQTADLTAFAGKTVQLLFQFHVAYSFDFYKNGDGTGWLVDDVTVFVQRETAASGLGENVGIDSVNVPIIGDYEDSSFTAHVRNDAAAPRDDVQLEWRWVGAKGALLASGIEPVTLQPGANTIDVTLPAQAKSQAAALRVTAIAPGDERLGDNEFSLSAPVQTVLARNNFEGASAGVGWTHAGNADEWQHGVMPAAKYPGQAASGTYVFGTDMNPSDDGNLNYEMNTDTTLTSPSFTIPAAGAVLSVRHAMNAPTAYGYYYDGGQVFAGGTKLTPQGGYPTRCGVPFTYDYYNPIPCFTGLYGWRQDTFVLDTLAGQSVSVDFAFKSDPNYIVATGWVIDDFLVIARPPLPTEDIAVSAPEELALDGRYADGFTVSVVNRGSFPSPAAILMSKAYRDDVFLFEQEAKIPPIMQGGAWPVALTLPDGNLDGVVYTFAVEPRLGGSPDQDPANDFAKTRISVAKIAYQEPFESGRGPHQAEVKAGAFEVQAFPASVPLPPSSSGFVAGFDESLFRASKQAGSLNEHAFRLPSMVTPEGGMLEFDHYYQFAGYRDGAVIEASTDGGGRWRTLTPEGGYPDLNDCGTSGGYYHRCFSGEAGSWSHVRIPLDSYAGKLTEIRFQYHTTGTPAIGLGWAIDNLLVRGRGFTDSFESMPRWNLGPIVNDNGPVEALSLPNAWGVGLLANTVRPGGWDVLESPAIPIHNIPSPIVGFDYTGEPEANSFLLVQALDVAGNWIELGRVSGDLEAWGHKEFPLPSAGDTTRLRFVYATSADSVYMTPGYFIDNVVVGSLTARLERASEEPDIFPIIDGESFTVPVKVTNTGAFTNAYTFTARGPDPYWYGNLTPEMPVVLEPGDSKVVNVKVKSPYGGEAGLYQVLIVAQSLYDPLAITVLPVPVDLSLSARPDWVVANVVMPGTTDDHGVWTIPDATRSTVFADISNVGDSDFGERPFVQFREHVLVDATTGRVEVRSFNASAVPPVNNFRSVSTDWTPRVGVIGLEVFVNPGFPIAEKSRLGNSWFQPMLVKPRSLPELALVSEPAFSRLPHTGEVTAVGLDVRNTGSSATKNPVDVSALANYQDALLVSPLLNLPGNDRLKIRYTTDLELRIDGIVVEARSGNGAWQRLVPEGGYPLGCILALRVPTEFGQTAPCEGGISGSSDGNVQTLIFKTRPLQGPSQFRLRFAMDSHNGRDPEGFTLLAVQVLHATFGVGEQVVKNWDFGQSGQGWTPSHTWAYGAAEGPQPGGWRIPREYANPFTFGLRSVPTGQCSATCLDVGQIGHVDMDWVPAMGGNVPITVYLDPHDAEPEFLDDANRFVTTRLVLDSDFVITPAKPLVLAHATAQDQFPVTLTNQGNHRAVFSLESREHPFFESRIEWEGRPITDLVLDGGQSFQADMFIRAVGAPAGTHSLVVDVYDDVSRKAFPFALDVRVDSGNAAPRVLGDLDFQVRQTASHTLLIENAGNAFLGVVLRVGDKPSGLAARIQPDEFTLRPFEARSVQVEFINLGVAEGEYEVELLNADTCGTTVGCVSLALLNVQVDQYAPPEAALSADTTSAGIGTLVQFADESVSVGSHLVSWAWTFGDGQTADVPTVTHAYLQPGAYEVRLTVTDADGAKDVSDPVVVFVGNQDPLARLSMDLQGGVIVPTRGVPLNLSAWDSIDTDGGIVNVTWAFGDGQLGHGANVSHMYQVAGNYRVTVAVEDTFGGVGVGTMDLTVVDPTLAEDVNLLEQDEGIFAKLPGPGPFAFLVALGLAFLAFVRRRRAGE